MKERPILFSGSMVRAILEGRKLVTRRVVKPQPQMVTDQSIKPWEGDASALHRLLEQSGKRCPYGQPGERLWVREAWAIDMLAAHSTVDGYHSMYALQYRADDAEREINVAPGEPDPYLALYDSQRGDWRPSIHMPRWASRILLEVTAVRVERLQDINRGDAMAEGCPFPNMAAGPDPRQWFAELWQEINGAESWGANPWVWVVEFKRVEAANA